MLPCHLADLELENRDMETVDGSKTAEFLGLTEQEYAVFCREGEASLKNMLVPCQAAAVHPVLPCHLADF